MIHYDPKKWFTVFSFTKSDTLRRLAPLLIAVAVYTLFIDLIEERWLQLDDDHHLKNIPLMHSLLGFAISMLLVFRTNTAYDRWWEGRKLWGGLVNNSRNLAIKINTFLPPELQEERYIFSQLISLFAHYLRRHLQLNTTAMELDETIHEQVQLSAEKHVPNQIVSVMWQRIQNLYRNDYITGDQLIVLNAEMQSFLDVCGACERIKNTPIPFSYSLFIKKFILIYTITLPFGYVFSLGLYAIPVVTFIFYVLASLELIAEEVEDPFGKDENDLPMQKIAANIKKSVEDVLL